MNSFFGGDKSHFKPIYRNIFVFISALSFLVGLTSSRPYLKNWYNIVTGYPIFQLLQVKKHQAQK